MAPTVSTEVLCLLNMVTEEELRDDDEFEGNVLIKIFVDLNHFLLYFFFRYHGRCTRRV